MTITENYLFYLVESKLIKQAETARQKFREARLLTYLGLVPIREPVFADGMLLHSSCNNQIKTRAEIPLQEQ